MARASTPPQPPLASAADQADKQLLISAIQKSARGEKLTSREHTVHKRWAIANEERTFLAVCVRIPQKFLKLWTGRRVNQLQEAQELDGWPVAGKFLDLPVFLKFLFDWRAKHARHLRNDDPDQLLVGPGSPALERYRAVKAKREQFAHERELRQWFSRAEVETVFNPFASNLKRACETIQRNNLAGTEAVEQIRETLEEARVAMMRMLTEETSEANPVDNGDDSDGDKPADPS
jgi:hypothetical protein